MERHGSTDGSQSSSASSASGVGIADHAASSAPLLIGARNSEATNRRLNELMIDARAADAERMGDTGREDLTRRVESDFHARSLPPADSPKSVYERALVSYTREMQRSLSS